MRFVFDALEAWKESVNHAREKRVSRVGQSQGS